MLLTLGMVNGWVQPARFQAGGRILTLVDGCGTYVPFIAAARIVAPRGRERRLHNRLLYVHADYFRGFGAAQEILRYTRDGLCNPLHTHPASTRE